ncbi:MAG: gamma-glutamyl-gamma-aminobutyrate hydrolase family protein, partial [Vagococcus sp.]
VPFLGICLGMQMACVEFARNVIGIEDADSGETNPTTSNKIIDLMQDQEDVENLGGTLRLGLYPCVIKEGTTTAKAYHNQEVVEERHRHRYEFNNTYRPMFEEHGMTFSGVSPDGKLVEIVELSDKKYFVASQFHPELISRPNRPQLLFSGFINACVNEASE